jgi:Ca-activated chloride channel family protein
LAQESNGRHNFVENDSGLERVFEAEAQQLTETVASGAEVSIDLAPGVELDRVFDRSFRRAGGRVIVPLGTFAAGEVKTVLLKVRIPGQAAGKAPVADVELGYRDLVANLDSKCNGSLDVEFMENPADASELDGVVSGRVQRSETAAILKTANDLFARGQFDDARKKLDEQQRSLNAIASSAAKASPSPRAGDVARDFKAQIDAVTEAEQSFARPTVVPAPTSLPFGVAAAPPAPPAPPPQATREGKGAVKRNVERADAFGF